MNRERSAAAATWYADLARDFRYGFRGLVKRPGFTIVAVVTLALGIGASTTVFSVFNSVVLRPLPYPQPERLVKIWNQRPGVATPLDNFSEGEHYELAHRNKTFEGLAAYRPDRSANLAGGSHPATVTAAEVDARFFPVMATAPLVGRGFLDEEDVPGNDHAIVLSHGIWQRAFGSDKSILGTSILVNGVGKQVVGVMPPGFEFPTPDTEVWLPLALPKANVNYNSGQTLRLVGRLKPDVSLEQAQGDISTVAEHLSAENLTRYPGTEAWPIPLRDDIVGSAREPLLLVLFLVGLVLLIACANVAGLQLERSTARQRTFALQMALGARRSRVIREMLVENHLLALVGAVLGLLLAYVGIKLLTALEMGGLPRLQEVRIDGLVLVFAIVAAVVVTVLTGILPAIRASGLTLSQSLREGGRSLGGRAGLKTQNLLVMAEVALCFILLTGAGLMGKTVVELLSVDPGFRTERLLTVRTSLPAAKYPDATSVSEFFRQALGKIRNLPGVESAGAVTTLPLSGTDARGFAWAEGIEFSPDILPPRLDMRWVYPGYLDTMGIPLISGRMLNEQDGTTDLNAAVLSKSLAETLWPGEDPLGKRFKLSRRPTEATPWQTVVGVVGDHRHSGLDSDWSHTVYFSFMKQSFWRNLFLVVHTSIEAETLIPSVRKVILDLDPEQPVYAERTMEQLMARSVARQRLAASLVSVFAALALVMATIGLYGVVSYGVSQRTREFGLRLALATSPRTVLNMVLKEGLLLALIGIAVGLGGALVLTRYITSFLFGVSHLDPITFVAVSLALLAAAMLACYVPARRAVRVDPVIALRYE